LAAVFDIMRKYTATRKGKGGGVEVLLLLMVVVVEVDVCVRVRHMQEKLLCAFPAQSLH